MKEVTYVQYKVRVPAYDITQTHIHVYTFTICEATVRLAIVTYNHIQLFSHNHFFHLSELLLQKKNMK